MSRKLNPPIVDNIIRAQISNSEITIPFMMNKSVGWEDFDSIELILKSVHSNTIVETLSCEKRSIVVKGKIYEAIFDVSTTLQVGQYYKIQLAYKSGETVGFYSNVATFKCTSLPSVSIQNLTTDAINAHIYDYTGVYTNEDDPSEKVYSYQFDLYDRSNNLLASSGEILHNSSLDTSTTQSTNQWASQHGLEPGREYLLTYQITTLNGLKISSPTYRIVDGQTVPSNIFRYYNFVAVNNMDSACIELSLQPKNNLTERKLINGKFILTRASSEDNFQTWKEMTRFILASYDSSQNKFLCRDYSIKQGITYVYGIQAYNNQGVYTVRQETKPMSADFEDMFLSDGERQLKIRFNPKVSSFKTTILESKMDTLGGKYPFFFRNGNVNYKEFPISGLISLLSDENEDFMKGIQLTEGKRRSTPAANDDYQELATSLTTNNFKREREFKMEVLSWLTNGKPKLFRSPGEGNFIVRLMNTSLTPNDTLGRMIHTFQCTAYEMADFTFENLKKYKMLIEDYIETRALRTYSINLFETSTGELTGLNACLATIHAKPGVEFNYKLANDAETRSLIIGPTGVYNFLPSVLQENPLMKISHSEGKNGWFPEATLIYSVFDAPKVDEISYVHSIKVEDTMAQWIGSNRAEIPSRFGTYPLKTDVGLIYYLNIQKRDIIKVDSAERSGSKYTFTINNVTHIPVSTELVYWLDPDTQREHYFDGRTSKEIIPNYKFKLRDNEEFIDFEGTGTLKADGEDFGGVTLTGGRIILSNLSNVDCLYLGNGLYAELAYQIVTKTYTIEETSGTVADAKDIWEQTPTQENYQIFYDTLREYLESVEGGLIIDAI